MESSNSEINNDAYFLGRIVVDLVFDLGFLTIYIKEK